MEAGRELDAKIAEKVFGKPKLSELSEIPKVSEIFLRAAQFMQIPNYSTNMAAAWEILIKIGLPYSITNDGIGNILVRFDNGKFSASAKSEPHAICLAALEVIAKR